MKIRRSRTTTPIHFLLTILLLFVKTKNQTPALTPFVIALNSFPFSLSTLLLKLPLVYTIQELLLVEIATRRPFP